MGRHWTTSITLRLPLEKARTAPPWCSSLASAIIYCLAGWTSQSQHMHQQNLLPCPIITWHQMGLFFCSSQIQHTITHLDVCYQVCRAFLQSVLQAPFQLCNSVIISSICLNYSLTLVLTSRDTCGSWVCLSWEDPSLP